MEKGHANCPEKFVRLMKYKLSKDVHVKTFPKTEKKKQKKRKEKASSSAGQDGNARLFEKIRFEDWRFFQKPEGPGLVLPG
jgi:hypothetical protein